MKTKIAKKSKQVPAKKVALSKNKFAPKPPSIDPVTAVAQIKDLSEQAYQELETLVEKHNASAGRRCRRALTEIRKLISEARKGVQLLIVAEREGKRSNKK